MTTLLPANTLTGIRVGFSVSESADLVRLGLFEGHLRLAVGELARTVLVLGGSLQYCGHLDHDGYTSFLIGELKRYGRQNEPLSVLLAWPVHRRLSLSQIRLAQNDLGLFGTIQALDLGGNPCDFASERAEDPVDVKQSEIGPGLTAMRVTAIRQTRGRLFVGGRRSGYQGAIPGVLEEGLLALASDQPIFLAGGFGGVTYDMVKKIDPNSAEWYSPDSLQTDDSGWKEGLEKLSGLIKGRGWGALANGLTPAENSRLAATHRASEIAALVSLGLGRLAGSI